MHNERSKNDSTKESDDAPRSVSNAHAIVPQPHNPTLNNFKTTSKTTCRHTPLPLHFEAVQACRRRWTSPAQLCGVTSSPLVATGSPRIADPTVGWMTPSPTVFGHDATEFNLEFSESMAVISVLLTLAW